MNVDLFLLCDISDHLPACVITKLLVCKKQLHKYITIANNSAIAFNHFKMKFLKIKRCPAKQ